MQENNPEWYKLLLKVDAARQKVKYDAIKKKTADRMLDQDERAILKVRRENAAAKQKRYRERKKAAKSIEDADDGEVTIEAGEQVQQIETPEVADGFELEADTVH